MTAQQVFLTVQAGLVALLLAAAVVWRRSQPTDTPTVGRLDEVELAAINGGPQLAVITAVTALRRSHVTQTPERTLVASGPLGKDELRAAGGQLPVAVAMFGAAALWTTDPAFAEALGIPAQTETMFSNADAFAAGWSSGCGGCGCGGGYG